jgi:signal transduction histidine kinase
MRSDLLASVTHELRTPINSVRGFLSLVLDGKLGPLAPDQRRYLAIAHRNTDRLIRLADDLALIARADSGRLDLRFGAVELERIVRDSVESERLRAEELNVVLEIYADSVPLVSGDGARLAQLTDNLVGNAIKFTPPGGRVEVRVEREDRHVRLAVADSGIGISEADQDRIFDAFYRAADVTQQPIPGTGLGLAISKAIVEGHAGSIEVSSTEGHGTTFTVRLPVAAEKLASVPA